MTKEAERRKEWDPATNTLETELGNGWMVIETFQMQGGRRVVSQLTICPAPPPALAGTARKGRRKGETAPTPVPPGGITARLLREVKVGKYAEVIADYRNWVRQQFGVSALRRLDKHAGRPSRTRRKQPMNRRASDRFYAELARDYTLLWQQRVRSPTAELARLRGVPVVKVRSHIHLARVNGFLTDTSRGKAGGELTKKAINELSRLPVREDA